MSDANLDRWEREFRAAAMADHCGLFREHLRRLSSAELLNRQLQRGESARMVDATVSLVRMCAAYAAGDGVTEKFEGFLRMQQYDPAEPSEARYVFTFDLCGKAFARVLLETKVQTLDLADLYGTPWPDYRVVGFDYLWISHPDWSDLTNDEFRRLEEEVENDLRCDYAQDELEISFDDRLDEAYLLVTVGDAYSANDE